jgi:hypothetical protein
LFALAFSLKWREAAIQVEWSARNCRGSCSDYAAPRTQIFCSELSTQFDPSEGKHRSWGGLSARQLSQVYRAVGVDRSENPEVCRLTSVFADS